MLLRRLLADKGLKDGDYAFREIGASQQRFDALKNEAMAILPERLKVSPEAASRAFDEFAARPRPQITPEGLQQVIDIVWEAAGLAGPKAAPDKYLDRGYLRKAMRQ